MTERKSVQLKLDVSIWHKAGIEAATRGITKRNLVEMALNQVINSNKSDQEVVREMENEANKHDENIVKNTK